MKTQSPNSEKNQAKANEQDNQKQIENNPFVTTPALNIFQSANVNPNNPFLPIQKKSNPFLDANALPTQNPFLQNGNPSHLIQKQASPEVEENEDFESLWKKFEQAKLTLYHDYLQENPKDLAIKLVDMMNESQAEKYGMELYHFLRFIDEKQAFKALMKFEGQITTQELENIKPTTEWGDLRRPEHLLSEAENEFARGVLTNTTLLLKSSMMLAQAKYLKTSAEIKSIQQHQEEDANKFVNFKLFYYQEEEKQIAQLICSIYHFYDWKALELATSPTKDTEQIALLMTESDKVQSLLHFPHIIRDCMPIEPSKPTKKVITPSKTPEKETPITPNTPNTPKNTQTPHLDKAVTPAFGNKDGVKPSDVADSGFSFKKTFVLKKTNLLKNPKQLGKYFELDAINVFGEVGIQVTIMGTKEGDKQYTLLEIETDKGLHKIKVEAEQKVFDALKSGDASFGVKLKEGFAFNQETGEVGGALESDLWDGGSIAFKFNLLEYENTLKVGVITVEGKVSPLGIAKLCGFDLNKYLEGKIKEHLPFVKGFKIEPKIAVEVKVKPNWVEILKKLGELGIKRAGQTALLAGAEAGIPTGVAAIGAAGALSIGSAVVGMASIIAAGYLSIDDNQRMKAVISDSKRACRDFRNGFLSALGFHTKASNKLFYEDGARAGNLWLQQNLASVKLKEGTAEYDLAKEGKSDEEIKAIVKEKFKLTFSAEQMYENISPTVILAENQIKEAHIEAWKIALGWRANVSDYKHEELIIRSHLYPKFNAQGKRNYY
jgi:hypothetical protein